MNLRKLALAACEDDAALPVLGDAVLESGWVDRRVCRLMLAYSAVESKAKHREYAAAPTREWARACAAVLMFGGWAKGYWPWLGTHGVRPPPMTSAQLGAMVRRLWTPDAVREQLYRESPVFAMLTRSRV